MRSSRFVPLTGVVVFGVLVAGGPLAAQRGARTGGPAPAAGMGADPMAGPLVTGAPFSADATTTVTQTLGDGTRIEQRANAKFYRDGAGRVRRDLTIIGLDALNPSSQTRTVVSFDSVPGDPMPFTLDPMGRTAVRRPRGADATGRAVFFLNGAPAPAGLVVGDRVRMTSERINDLLAATTQLTDPERAQMRELERALNSIAQSQGLTTVPATIPGGLKPAVEQLGSRQIDGVKATGRRTTVIIPTDRVGNDRPMQIVEERWESPELNLVVSSRYSDPRTGVIEYRLSNIVRSEPSADLFQVPSDYTVMGSGRGGPAAVEPGARGGGVRGGGARGGRQ